MRTSSSISTRFPPLEIHLQFSHKSALAGIEYRERREDELRTLEGERGVECSGVRDELAEDNASLHV